MMTHVSLVASQSPTTPSSKRLQQHPLTFGVTPPPGRMRTPTSQKPFPVLSSKNSSPSALSPETEPTTKTSLVNLHSPTGTHQSIVSEVLPETPDGTTRKLDGLKNDDPLNSMSHTLISDQQQVFAENSSNDTLDQSVDPQQTETVQIASADIRETEDSLVLQTSSELDELVITKETDAQNKDQMDDTRMMLTVAQQEDESNLTASNQLSTNEIIDDYSETKTADEFHPIVDATRDESLSMVMRPNECETITTETNISMNIEKHDDDDVVTGRSTSPELENVSNIISVDPIVADNNSTLLEQEDETFSLLAKDLEQANPADGNKPDDTDKQLLLQTTASNSLNCSNTMDSIINQSTPGSLHIDQEIVEQIFSQEPESPIIDGSVMNVVDHQTSLALSERQEFEQCKVNDTDKKYQHNSPSKEMDEYDASLEPADMRNLESNPSSILENAKTDLIPDQSSFTTTENESINSSCSSERNEGHVEHDPLVESITTLQGNDCTSPTHEDAIEKFQSVTQENNDIDPYNGLRTALIEENQQRSPSPIPNDTDAHGNFQDFVDNEVIESDHVRPRSISISSTKTEQNSHYELKELDIKLENNEVSSVTLNEEDSPRISPLTMTRENTSYDDNQSSSANIEYLPNVLNLPINDDQDPVPMLRNSSEPTSDVLESSTEVDSSNNEFKQVSLHKESESPIIDKDSVEKEISSVHLDNYEPDNPSSSIEDSAMLPEKPQISTVDSKDTNLNLSLVLSEDKIESDHNQSPSSSSSSSSLDKYQTKYESIHTNFQKTEFSEEDNLILDSKSKRQSILQLSSPGEKSEESTGLGHASLPIERTNTNPSRQSSSSSLVEMVSNTDSLLQNSETIRANSQSSSPSNDNYQQKYLYPATAADPVQQLASVSNIESSQIEETTNFANDNNSIERSKSLSSSAIWSLNGEDSLQSPVVSTSIDQHFDSSITSISAVDRIQSIFGSISTPTAIMTESSSPISTAITAENNTEHDQPEIISPTYDRKISLSPIVAADKIGESYQETNIPRLPPSLSAGHEQSNADLENIQAIKECAESNNDSIVGNSSIERSPLVEDGEVEPVILSVLAQSHGDVTTNEENRDQSASVRDPKDKTSSHEYENTSGNREEDLPISYSASLLDNSNSHQLVETQIHPSNTDNRADKSHNSPDDFLDSKRKASEAPTLINTDNTDQSSSVHRLDTVSSVMLSSTKSIELLPDTISAPDTDHQSNITRSFSQAALSRPTTLPFTSNNPDLDGLAIAYQNNNDDEDLLSEQEYHQNSASIPVDNEQRRSSLSNAANNDKQELSSNPNEIVEQSPVRKESSVEGNRYKTVIVI